VENLKFLEELAVGLSEHGQFRAVAPMDCAARGIGQAGGGVQVVFAALAHRNRVGMASGGETARRAPVDSDRVQMIFQRGLHSRRVVDLALGRIHAGHFTHFPGTRCELSREFSVQRVHVQVPETIAFARPEKLVPSGEEAQVVAHIHPVRAGLAQQQARGAGGGVGSNQVHAVLHAVERDGGDGLAVRQPLDAC